MPFIYSSGIYVTLSASFSFSSGGLCTKKETRLASVLNRSMVLSRSLDGLGVCIQEFRARHKSDVIPGSMMDG